MWADHEQSTLVYDVTGEDYLRDCWLLPVLSAAPLYQAEFSKPQIWSVVYIIYALSVCDFFGFILLVLALDYRRKKKFHK